MAPCSIALLALGLCLGQEIHAQEGALPRPSISAEPGSMIPWGRPMTIVCRAPAGFEDSRLEKEGSSQIWDKRATSPSEREARFLFPSMSEDTAGRYRCRYLKSTWSELSEDLTLVLSREDVTQVTTSVPAQPSGAAQVASEDGNHPGERCGVIPHEPGCALEKGKDWLWWWSESSSASAQFVPGHRERPLGPPGSGESDSLWQQSCARRSHVHAQQQHRGLCGVLTPVPPPASPALLLTTEHLYLFIGVPLALLLCLLLLLLFCLHRQHQRKQGPPGGKGQLQRPQERLGLAVDSLERSPDLATADRLPEKDRETGNPTPAARDPQEVTYAQLDYGALTERAARAGSPLTPEPSTYATVARH
ncbi:leukocyte-associated immunoglobulin-like receptor 1 isoform X2 [Marmota marmota marmota]|uniref:leukocyte-associated immunoglobulin-like receptor 1 isoform X2 n=1 Tax=Marmota marmota marmota TaxID=9994 RepID=UPI0020925CA2|nr:leukocyte-associated immunoglobulin-like receptor 1 isoform X2 [Marmota marmota marmota]